MGNHVFRAELDFNGKLPKVRDSVCFVCLVDKHPAWCLAWWVFPESQLPWMDSPLKLLFHQQGGAQGPSGKGPDEPGQVYLEQNPLAY